MRRRCFTRRPKKSQSYLSHLYGHAQLESRQRRPRGIHFFPLAVFHKPPLLFEPFPAALRRARLLSLLEVRRSSFRTSACLKHSNVWSPSCIVKRGCTVTKVQVLRYPSHPPSVAYARPLSPKLKRPFFRALSDKHNISPERTQRVPKYLRLVSKIRFKTTHTNNSSPQRTCQQISLKTSFWVNMLLKYFQSRINL